MEVKVAKTAGFCFGVKRAVEKAYEVAEQTPAGFILMDPLFTTKKWCRIWRKKASGF